MQEKTIKVWDVFVRLFHWSLVAGFFTAYLTEDDLMTVHTWAGYLVVALVLVRIVWGFVGTRHARFADFVFRPMRVIQYVKDIFTLRARRYLGHNPAGGAMIVALLIAIVLTGLSGMLVYGVEEHAGPLAGMLTGVGESWSEVFEEAHEFLANLTLLLVVGHVAGVVVESLLHHENLVRAMFTGYKRAE